jgi:hypothetical protein
MKGGKGYERSYSSHEMQGRGDSVVTGGPNAWRLWPRDIHPTADADPGGRGTIRYPCPPHGYARAANCYAGATHCYAGATDYNTGAADRHADTAHPYADPTDRDIRPTHQHARAHGYADLDAQANLGCHQDA